jgi:hypothetical protein
MTSRVLAAGFVLSALFITADAIADQITDIDPATGRDYSCEMQLGIQGCETLGMLTGPAKPKTPKTDVWGAVAVGPNLNWGISHNAKTQKEAQNIAIGQCMGLRGADCKLVATVPGYCVSLAMSNGDKKWAVSGITGALNVAESDSKFRCAEASCAIAFSFCADGLRHMWQPRGAEVSTKVAGTYACEDFFLGTLKISADGRYTRTPPTFFDVFVDEGTYRVAGKKVFLTSDKPNKLKNYALDVGSNGDLVEGGSRCKRK